MYLNSKSNIIVNHNDIHSDEYAQFVVCLVVFIGDKDKHLGSKHTNVFVYSNPCILHVVHHKLCIVTHAY